MLTEWVFRFGTSGFYGALTQAFRRVESERARRGVRAGAAAARVALARARSSTGGERHPSSLRASARRSRSPSCRPAFNLFAMRRGTLVVGDAGAHDAGRPARDAAADRAVRRHARPYVRPRMPVTSLHLTNAWHAASGGIRTFYTRPDRRRPRRDGRRVVLVVPGERTAIARARTARAHLHRSRRRGRRRSIGAIASSIRRSYLPLVGGRLSGDSRPRAARRRRDLRQVLAAVSRGAAAQAAAARRRRARRARGPELRALRRQHGGLPPSRAAPPAAFTRWYIRHIYGPPFDVARRQLGLHRRRAAAALHDRAPGFVRVCPMGVDTRAFGPDRRSREVRARARRAVWASAPAPCCCSTRAGSRRRRTSACSSTRCAPLIRDDPRSATTAWSSRATARWRRWLRAQATRCARGAPAAVRQPRARRSLAARCASCDVFVHPNPREPFGIGPLEAMASGVPVVLPDAGGVLSYAAARTRGSPRPTAAAFAGAIRAAAAGDPADRGGARHRPPLRLGAHDRPLLRAAR